jgi:ankyrin repeat protein
MRLKIIISIVLACSLQQLSYGQSSISSTIKEHPTKVYNNGKLGDNAKLGRRLLRIVQKRECTTEIVEGLLNNGADVNVKERLTSDTPLIYAIERQPANIVKMLIDAGANVNYRVKYATRQSVLHIAVSQQDAAKVKMLIDAGADVNVQENFEVTPLLIASGNKNTTITKLLLDGGADANLKDHYGNTPLHKAIYQNESMIKVLLDAGADINAAKDFSGATPLHYAARDLDVTIVGILINAGADVNAKFKIQNDSGFGYSYWTPLDLAKYNEKQDVVALLSRYGAK